ncbi:MAG TPA: hypothetical protein VLJ57_24015 [Burkholderiaceae bacterium]|nr:hypothetical protein [Burkholderiaceae bacterium]
MNLNLRLARNGTFKIGTCKSRRHMRGLTLMETTLVIALAGIVMGGALMLYRSNTADAGTSRQIDGIISFASKSQETFGLSGGNWSAFTPDNMIKLNRIPDQFSKDTTKIYDNFRNEVVFTAPAVNQGVVSFIMRSPQECAKITQAVADLTYKTAVGAAGSETVVKPANGTLDVAAMATGCDTANRVLNITLR